MPIARFWALLVAALLIAAPLSAQEESVHLEYDASTGCPDRAAFVAEVTARTTRARFVDEGRDVRTFKTTIRTQGERTIGSLISNTGQTGAERRVSGKTCSEVVSALALITALAIDPSASTGPSPSAAPESPASANQKADAAASANAAAKPSSAPITPTDPNHGPPTSSSWGLSWGAGGEGSYGFTTEGAPLTMVGGSVHAEMGPFARERRGPLFRIGAFLLHSTKVYRPESQPLGEATFTLVGGRLSWSPLFIRISTAIELHPWLSAEIGRLNGSGATGPGDLLANTHDYPALWLAVGEGLEARWSLGDRFWLALDLRAVEPLIPYTFVFLYGPGRTAITSVPFFEGVLGLGLGGRIL